MGNREALFEAAKQCLREKGYDRTSVRDLATAAGVSMAAIGYHYGSRETLLNQALFALLDETGDASGRTLVRDGESAAQGYARLWEETTARSGAAHDAFVASVELFLQAQRRPELREALREGMAHGRRGLAGILQSVPEGDVSDHAARTLGAVQMALVTGIMVQTLSDPDHAPTVAEILEGLRALALLAGPSSGTTSGTASGDPAGPA